MLVYVFAILSAVGTAGLYLAFSSLSPWWILPLFIGGFVALDSASTDQLYNRPERLAESKHSIKVRFGRAVKLALVALLVGVVNSFIPSTKQAAAIIVIPKIANSEIVAEMGDTAKELVGLAKAWLVELKPQSEIKNKEVKK